MRLRTGMTLWPRLERQHTKLNYRNTRQGFRFLYSAFFSVFLKQKIILSEFSFINTLLDPYTRLAYIPQGVEEHQTVLLEKQSELAQLQGEHNAKVLEAQKLQRALDRKEQELADLQQAKEQLDEELEDLQQQKKNGDKALNV